MPRCSVYSAMTGEALAVVEEYEGKTAKEIKQIVAAQVGVSRFRQRFFSEDESIEIQDDEVFALASVNIQLVQLQCLPPDAEEDQKMIAAAKNNNVQVLEKLLQEPRSPNIKDAAGRTPLHHAAGYGHVEPMRLLLEAGAEKDARDAAGGWTPMLLAASMGRLESVGLLIEAGADTDLATLDCGATALFLAASRGHIRVVRALIEARADLNQAMERHGAMRFRAAAQNGRAEVRQQLIEALTLICTCSKVLSALLWAKADIGMSRMRRPNHEVTPLCAAVMSGHVQIARLLVEAGADLERGDCGMTPLCLAALNGHVDIVRFLIDSGASMERVRSSQQCYGTIPMLLAAYRGHVEVVQLLQEHEKAQQMRRASHVLPSAGPLWYTWRPVPIRVATVMQPVRITAVMTFVPRATGAPVASNPCGSSSSSAKAAAPRRKQKSCC